MSLASRLVAALPALSLLVPALLLAPREASALEVPNVGGKPLTIDITNTSILNYHFNNRNDARFAIPEQLDDNYGEWLDRLNIQLGWWRFRAGARIDSATYFLTPNRDTVAKLVADQKNLTDAVQKDPNEYTTEFYRELHTRYLRAIYPSKLYVGYSQPGIDVTIGDFYAQLGRGLVLSIRKIDELAVDTTARGAKIVVERQFGGIHLGGTFLAGQMNPIRVDEVSGRRLQGAGSPLFFGFPSAGPLETYTPQPGRTLDVIDLPRPNYLEDSIFGGRVEGGTKDVTIAANGSLLARKSYTAGHTACVNSGADTLRAGGLLLNGWCDSRFPDFTSTDPAKQHDRIGTFSGSVNVPSIAKHGDVYLEVAGQQLRAGHVGSTGPAKDISGYAVYGSATVSSGPVSISLEGKHYRSFFPLSANIDTVTPGFGAPEYSLVTYSQPPTAEPIYTEIVGGSPNVCISGGRARVDYRFDRERSVYGWVGRYSSWSENPAQPNSECQITSQLQTDTWDSAVGFDLGFEGGRTHTRAWVGARTTDRLAAEETAAGNTSVFYHEGYLRYDLVKHLSGPFSLQFQGFHRHRYEPIAFATSWWEGENYTALQWSPHFAAVFGYEYLVKDGCQPERPGTLSEGERTAKNVCHFVNGGLQWRSHGEGTGQAGRALAQIFDTVNIFAGQRRAALRCVSGVCRQFPAFEGAKLEITSRF